MYMNTGPLGLLSFSDLWVWVSWIVREFRDVVFEDVVVDNTSVKPY